MLVKVGVAGAEAAGQGPQGDRSRRATARSSIRATATRSTSSRRSPARSARGGGLGGLQPQRLIAAGESQSAFALVTYFNGVQPLTQRLRRLLRAQPRRGRAAARRRRASTPDIAGSIGGTPHDLPHRSGRARARHPDRDRRGERPQLVRGPPARHRSLPALGGRRHRARRRATCVGAERRRRIDCGVPINNGPMHIVAKAALRALDDLDHRPARRPPTRRAST